MPQNCSSDVEAVIAYLDEMYAANDIAGIQTLKEAFGLGDIVHVDDFASARKSSFCFSLCVEQTTRLMPFIYVLALLRVAIPVSSCRTGSMISIPGMFFFFNLICSC